MDIAQLVIELKPLCADPVANLEPIVDLLEQGRDMAEYEVARFMVAHAARGTIEPLLRSADPRERLSAIRVVHATYPRSDAGRVLRAMVKDPDPKTRARARHAVRNLGLDDVALPDTRFKIPRWVRKITPLTIGAWNPTGWAFGTMRPGGRRPGRKGRIKQFGLPRLGNAAAVAKLCGLSGADDLVRLSRPGTGPGRPYVEFDIPKAKGGSRRISAPKQELKRVQQQILQKMLAKLPVHDACHGFVTGRSTLSNAEPHLGSRVVIKMDLRDFFPSIHYRRVQGLFELYGYSSDVASLLAQLTTHRPVLADGTVAWPGVLPQGAPTSPALANLVCRRLDMRLAGLADKFSARYTRYADDLTFSFAAEPDIALGRFCWWVDQICQQEGFVENTAKRRILRTGNQQRITGIVVNSGLHVPRRERRRFRAILANCRKHGLASQARGRADFADYLRGYAAYVKMVQPELGSVFVAEVEKILAGEKADT